MPRLPYAYPRCRSSGGADLAGRITIKLGRGGGARDVFAARRWHPDAALGGADRGKKSEHIHQEIRLLGGGPTDS